MNNNEQIRQALLSLVPRGFEWLALHPEASQTTTVTLTGFDSFQVEAATVDVKAHCRSEMLRLGWPLKDVTASELHVMLIAELPAVRSVTRAYDEWFDVRPSDPLLSFRFKYEGRSQLIEELVAAGWKRKSGYTDAGVARADSNRVASVAAPDKPSLGLCECCGEREADSRVKGFASPAYRGVGLEGAAFSSLCCLGAAADRVAQMNDRIRARRAAIAAKPQQFYGTEPSPLPKTLPVGTRTIASAPCGQIAARNELRLTGNFSRVYVGWGHDLARFGVDACLVDWSTVTIQVEPTAEPAEAKPEPKKEEQKPLCSWCRQPSGTASSEWLFPVGDAHLHPKCGAFSRAHAERLASGGVDCPEERDATERFVRGNIVDRTNECIGCGKPSIWKGRIRCAECANSLNFGTLDQRIAAAQPVTEDVVVAWATPSAEGP